jgi:hypothetical protein
LLKVANSIHTSGKLVQIVLTFLILGITIIWCHSLTKLTSAGGKCIAGSLSKLFTLRCNFLSTLLLVIYPSWRLQMTQERTSSTTSSIALEEAQPVVILGTTPEEEARLAAILGTTKCRCLHVFTLDL